MIEIIQRKKTIFDGLNKWWVKQKCLWTNNNKMKKKNAEKFT